MAESDTFPLARLTDGIRFPRYGLLSNGLKWVLFRTFEPQKTMRERIMWTADLDSEDKDASLKRLEALSKDSIDRLEELIKKEEALEKAWDLLVTKPDKFVRMVSTPFINFLKEVSDANFDSSEVEKFLAGKAGGFGKTTIVGPTPANGVLLVGASLSMAGPLRQNQMKILRVLSVATAPMSGDELRAACEIDTKDHCSGALAALNKLGAVERTNRRYSITPDGRRYLN